MPVLEVIDNQKAAFPEISRLFGGLNEKQVSLEIWWLFGGLNEKQVSLEIPWKFGGYLVVWDWKWFLVI